VGDAKDEIEWVVYDALYAYCRQMAGLGKQRKSPVHALSG